MDIELCLTTDTVDQAGPMPPLCVTPDTPIREVFHKLRDHRGGSVLICRDEVLIGIFTERDALRLMARGGDLEAPVESAMVSDPVTLRAQAAIGAAILRMSSGGYRRMPIVDDAGRPTGVLQVSGIIHYLVEHFPKTVYNLPPVAHPLTQDREGP